MAEKKIKKPRKQIYYERDQKRKKTPVINTIRDVPEETIKQLEALATTEFDGSKKQAIIYAIDERYKKVIKGESNIWQVRPPYLQ